MNYDFNMFNNNTLPDSVVDFLTYLETIKNKSENETSGKSLPLSVELESILW